MEAAAIPARTRVPIGGSVRQRGRLDDAADVPNRSLEEIVAALTPAREYLLTGGEPTLRSDLPRLIAAVAAHGRTGMRTDGWALTQAAVIATLREAGLAFVVIPLPSARADAHDWLTMQRGSSRQVLKAIAACAAAGLRVEVEITLTRPTLAHAPETVEAAARLGASAIRLRRLTANGAASADFIALSPRLLQLLPAEQAIVRALELGLAVSIEGVPRCFLRATADNVVTTGDCGERCERCPGADLCDGLPSDYFARFGAGELRQTPLPEPPHPPESIAVVIEAGESSRSAGLRIARAAQLRPRTLRLVDVFAHPDAVELVREALRLDVRVEIAGDIRGLANIDHRARLHIARVARIDGALHNGDAEATLAAVQTHRNAGVYAVIESEDDLAKWAALEMPAFRLASRGGSLAALAAAMSRQRDEVKHALLPLLPACLHEESTEPFAHADAQWWGATAAERTGAANDRVGRFAPCPSRDACSRAARCPGLAAGWDATGIASR